MKKLLIVFALLLGFIGTANAGGYGGIGGAASSTTITGPWTFTSSVTINNVVDTSSAVVRDRLLIGTGATVSTMTASRFDYAGSTLNVVTGQLQTAGVRVGYNLSSIAAGTAYVVTATTAAVDFGTTDPSITIDQAGTYLILADVQLRYNAATFVANRTVTTRLRRTNNTAAYLGSADNTALTRVITTVTDEMGVFPINPLVYTTANTNDIVTIFIGIDTAPSAGSLDTVEATIIAVRLY